VISAGYEREDDRGTFPTFQSGDPINPATADLAIFSLMRDNLAMLFAIGAIRCAKQYLRTGQ
jgi:hypothetical protein